MKINKYILPLFCCLISIHVIAQNPFPKLAPVFKDDIIPKVFIRIDQDSLNEIFANIFSDHHYRATFIFDNTVIRDTVENIGFRLRGNTSRGANKKSFKISFNTFEQGRQWKKLEKLNLNGEHNDPTVTRSKLGWDILRAFEVPAPRCNHVELYLNNQYVGLYANVEQIDEEFVESRFGNKDGNLYKCLWPADLTFKRTNPGAYKIGDFGHRTYDLKTNKAADDYSDLANFITILNNTPDEDLVCELEKVFNVDSYLKAMIFDIVSANWDGPIVNKNNFYLYHNTATDKFEYIPFDIDNTFGIDWFGEDWASRDIYNYAGGNPERPIYNRIISIPEYRDRFSFYFKEFIDQYLQTDSLTTYLYQKRDLLASSIENDRFYPRDYGFKFADFLTSFDTKLSVNHVPIGLTAYLTKRIATALEQLVIKEIAPIINIDFDAFSNTIQLTARDDQQLQSIETCIVHADNTTTCEVNILPENGNVFRSSMTFSPNENNQGIYYTVIDNQGNSSRFPTCDFIQLNTVSSSISLFINEIMAANESTIADESGAFEDWIEIYNPTATAINLGGLYLSDKPNNPNKWAFPEVTIPAKGFLTLWADGEEAAGALHTNFKLNAGGEFIGIFDTEINNFALIDGFEFGEQVADISFGRTTDGGTTIDQLSPSPNTANAQLTTISEINPLLLTIYPNPATTTFQIEINHLQQLPDAILIKDILGRTHHRFTEVNQSTYTIPTNGLEKGIFLVVLDFGKTGQLVRKIIIK